MTATTLATPTEPVMTIGQRIEAQAGRHVISLQRTMPAVWHVEVYQGSLRIDDLCGSWDDEQAAGAAASGLLALYRAEGN